MKNITFLMLLCAALLYGQEKPKDKVFSYTPPELIPKKVNGTFGYCGRVGGIVIPPQYNIAMFFAEDCNLLKSTNKNAQKYGTAEFATVEKNKKAYRIDKTGKTVYTYKAKDLGQCDQNYHEQKYSVVAKDNKYGLAESSLLGTKKFKYLVKPQYDLVHIIEGEDLENPLMVAVKDNKFGVINKFNTIIIPFQYADIKRNFSWKIGKMFEVTQDGNEYFYIDINNVAF